MASAIKSALPSHMKPKDGDGSDAEFTSRHHGKTRSHMVSIQVVLPSIPYSYLCELQLGACTIVTCQLL